jgi:hypothetical protein|tara:strand:- start:31 stop:795 length:765 start_codon:yes stop_codon:yes gene_type:complete
MNVPDEIWIEILSYCDNSVERRLDGMNAQQLIELNKKIDLETNKKLMAIRNSVNINDIISIRHRNSDSGRDDIVGMVLTKAVSKTNPNSLKILMLQPISRNTPFGYYTFAIIGGYLLINLNRNDIKLIKKAEDTIHHNRTIAKALCVNDICEITPYLFTYISCPKCRHFALVVKKHTYANIEIQVIKIIHSAVLEHYDIVFEPPQKINTKLILKRINLQDNTDQDDNKINFLKGLIYDKVNHKNNLSKVLNQII